MGRLLIACALATGVADAKPVYRPPQTDPLELAARLEDAIRHRDATGVEAMLTDPLLYDQLWFADPTCALRFEGQGTLEGKDVRDLARCFAQQKLMVSTRRSSLPRGAIITLEPGIELEIMFKGNGIAYVGRPHPTDATRRLPSLTVQAFEVLRKTGTTQLDAALAGKLFGTASAWIETCLDKTGAITSSALVDAKPAAAGAPILAAIRDWTFAPFTIRKTPVAACGFTLISYPSASAPAIETLPAPAALPIPVTRISIDDEDDDFLFIKAYPGTPPRTISPAELENHRRSGSAKIEPDAATRAHIVKAGRSSILASLKLCVDETGSVSSVTGLKSSGFPDYDDKLTRALRAWTFRPYLVNTVATPVCTAFTFSYRPKR